MKPADDVRLQLEIRRRMLSGQPSNRHRIHPSGRVRRPSADTTRRHLVTGRDSRNPFRLD